VAPRASEKGWHLAPRKKGGTFGTSRLGKRVAPSQPEQYGRHLRSPSSTLRSEEEWLQVSLKTQGLARPTQCTSMAYIGEALR
jgi:hypothetical protein